MLSHAFISVLRSGRNEFNAQFAETRRVHPTLEAQEFSVFIEDCMDPLVRAVEAVRADAVYEVVCAAWEVALELTAQHLVGPKARQPWMAQLWKQVLVAAAPIVAGSPRLLIGALSNAVHQIGATAGARPEQWLRLMTTLSSLTTDADIFLKAGQVAAWRSGLAHYRAGALAAAADLPDAVALAALDADGQSWPRWHAQLLADPWALPVYSAGAVTQTGSFRGFGGLFTQPPLVASVREHLLVRSGDESWVLAADAFGATFHRATPDETQAAAHEVVKLPPDVRVPEDIGTITSVARTGNTLAVTGSLTHAVLLFPLPPPSPS